MVDPTEVTYNNQQITGCADGHFTIQVGYSKSGGCAVLLSYHQSFG